MASRFSRSTSRQHRERSYSRLRDDSREGSTRRAPRERASQDDSRPVNRGRSPLTSNHNGIRDGTTSRGRSRSRSLSRGSTAKSRSVSPYLRSTKIVVEKLTKNVMEQHLKDIFSTFGPIRDLDLPMNRQFGTNRGTAYILFVHEADAAAAVCSMHEAQIDGNVINVSIVLPRRKFSPAPPTARRGANIDPRIPAPHVRDAVRRRRSPMAARYGAGGALGVAGGHSVRAESDTYRPRTISRSLSRSRSRSLVDSIRGRYRSRSPSRGRNLSVSRSPSPAPRSRRNASYDTYSRSRSRSPAPRRGEGRREAGNGMGGGRGGRSRYRSPSRTSDRYSRSPSRARGGGGGRRGYY